MKYDVLLGKFLERFTVFEGLYKDNNGLKQLNRSDVNIWGALI
jgi:hypothetical protein